MHDTLEKNYPYNQIDYDSRFINRKVITAIRRFCEREDDVAAFYAKGSITNGCMVKDSDIDHIRIRVHRYLQKSEKVQLVDRLETALNGMGVTVLRRIREDNYIRVFVRWAEIEHLPDAAVREHELWPHLDILTAKSEEDWLIQLKSFETDAIEKWHRRMVKRVMPMRYNVFNEYVNIDNYSPFSHINEISPQYRYQSFNLPFVKFDKIVPVHPDTFDDFNVDPSLVCFYRTVYPTSSFRTVYYPDTNTCFKLPTTRRITRSIRGLSRSELREIEVAQSILTKYDNPRFRFLRDTVMRCEDERFSYVIRNMPTEKIYPWFYAIKSQKFSREFMLMVMKNMIDVWFYWAGRDILLEAHTQNILFDEDGVIYYRDVGDIRSCHIDGLQHRHRESLTDPEIMSLIFDRTLCNQNLSHVFRVTLDTKLGADGIMEIKEYMDNAIQASGIEFPNYSMDFPIDRVNQIPTKTKLTIWRD